MKIADKNGEDVRIIDLAKFSYHFVKPPKSTGPASPVKTAKGSSLVEPLEDIKDNESESDNN